MAETELTIRPYRSDDLDLLRKIMVDAFDGISIDQGMEAEFGLINGRDWKWRKGRHLDADVERDPEGIFVAEVEGEVVGFVSTWQDARAGIGHIPNISLVPECRGQGIGRKLLQYVLDRFRENGLRAARIETLVQNERANHLYASLGFREAARQIHFVANLGDAT